MSDDHDSPEAIAAAKKKYWAVFGVLLVGTIVTVLMYFVYFEKMWQTVTVALIIASFKAACVAAIFMHLWGEKKLVYQILYPTIFFVAGLFALTLWAYADPISMTTHVR
jgi:caa(3)-type oxidase subunit IV